MESPSWTINDEGDWGSALQVFCGQTPRADDRADSFPVVLVVSHFSVKERRVRWEGGNRRRETFSLLPSHHPMLSLPCLLPRRLAGIESPSEASGNN